MTDSPPLGSGTPGSHYPAALEESKARADARRMDRSREGSYDIDSRSRTIGVFFLAAVTIALLTYVAWSSFGPVVGVVAGAVLTAGAFLLWRFWR